MSIRKLHSNCKQQGFTLIEVLVGLVILAIGLLSMAGLQTVAKKANFEAVQRTTATMLAEDIIERMRANAINEASLPYYITAAPITDQTGTAKPSPACDSSNPCTPQELAARDLWEWEQAIIGASNTTTGGDGLYLPSACITQNAAIDDTVEYSVAIAWRGRSKLTNPTAHPCGEGSGLYDDDETGEADVYRRLTTLTILIRTGL